MIFMVAFSLIMYKDWLELIAANRSLQGADFRVLLTLMANTQGATAEISQAEISKKVGIESSHVSRCIRKLIENGIIRKKHTAGKLVGYRFLIEESEEV